MVLDSRVGVVMLAGGLFLLFPIFNTLNTEQYSQMDPPEIDPPDNLPDIDPPPIDVKSPPPVPPCIPTDRKLSLFWPGQASRDNVSQALPAQAVSVDLWVNHTYHFGSTRITLYDPNGTSVWDHSRSELQALSQPSSSHPYRDIPLGKAGSWNLVWDVRAAESGFVSLVAIVHIRCDAPAPSQGGGGGST